MGGHQTSLERRILRVVANHGGWPDDNVVVVEVWLQTQPEAIFDLAHMAGCLPSAASILRVAARLRAAARRRVAA